MVKPHVGTTRRVIHFYPFSLVFEGGEGGYVTDVDGHRYLDLCAEYSACLFGHSHPTVIKAMHAAIDKGISLGGVNKYEGRLAQLLTSRFAGMDMVRFSNSGTETNMTALNVARAYTGRDTIIVMKGGYHGGLAAFAKGDPKNGIKSMNSPLKWVVTPFNDVEALGKAVAAHRDDLSCIMVELMQGSSGCLPASRGFIQAARDLATETGAVLMFDEVMTSRMSTGGMQRLMGITPDMTTLGKYLAGGGQNFGAFGGKSKIMSILVPGHPSGVYHSGTFNNNVTTMATAVEVLERIWDDREAHILYELGNWLRDEINRVGAAAGGKLKASGVGSLLSVHFTDGEIRNVEDVQERADLVLKELFFFDMLRRGFYIAQRGMISLMTVHTRDQLQTFVAAIEEWLVERRNLL